MNEKELYEQVYADASLAWIAENLQILHEILSCIREGDTEHIHSLIRIIPPEFEARFGDTPLRHMKNLVISLIQMMAITAMDAGVCASLCIRHAERMIRAAEETDRTEELMRIADQAKIRFCELSAEIKEEHYSDIRIQKAAAYIREHVAENITRKQLSEIAGMSEEYFSRRFHEETGKTISAYIQSAKIQRAKRMLKETDESLSAISSYLSFSSQNYFQNVFRKQEHMTPGQYRKQKRAEK